MANVSYNMLVKQGSGKIGDYYLKTRGDKTFLCKKPDFSNRVLSNNQEEWNDRLREANIYARKVEQEDPELWAFYTKKSKKKNLTVHNVAVKDFMTLPKIDKIDIDLYKGEPGNFIIIDVSDLYEVKAVNVSIVDAARAEIEGGEAVKIRDSNFHWTYETKTSNPGWQEGRIIVKIRDIPGNEVLAILEKDSLFVGPLLPDAFPSQGGTSKGHWRRIEGAPRERRRKGGGKTEKRRRISRPWWKFWRWF